MHKRFKRYTFSFVSFVLATSFFSCNKDISISLDQNNNESLNVAIMDTASIQVSTLQLNDIPTFASGTILVGKNNDLNTGLVSATSYFRFGVTGINKNIPENASFDSVTVVFKPTRYSYGDTTKVQTIAIHRLEEAIELQTVSTTIPDYLRPAYLTSTSALYNHSTVPYSAAALGKVSFLPAMRALDSVTITLANTFGQELFDYVQNENIIVNSDNNFQEYLKGFALVPDAANTALIGLQDTAFLKVHYSYPGNVGRSYGNIIFPIGDKNHQFNNISADRTGTPYQTLSSSQVELPSESTNGAVFLEGGTGVVAKLTFPSLRAIVSDNSIVINKVQLIIETPSAATFSQTPPPASLILMVGNGSNVAKSTIPFPGTTNTQTVGLIKGDDVGSNGRYVFDLIDYLRNIQRSTYDDTSLLLSLPTTSLFSTGNRLHIATEDNKPKIKLNIVYTKF